MSRLFYAVLANSLVASVTNTFVWFAVTFWVFLETRSVIATSVMAGIFTVTVALSGFLLGSVVDRFRKKTAMLISTAGSIVFFATALGIYLAAPGQHFNDAASPVLWVFVVLTLGGALIGNLRGIALSTLVTILVDEPERDRANGLVGTVNGASFLVASIISGLVIGFLGVSGMLLLALALLVPALVHLWFLNIDEGESGQHAGQRVPIDVPGTIRAIRVVPGLLGLILFHTFNNFLVGVFMALMDAYGLMLVSVQTWGTLWGALSLGFILGGLIVARWGLGASPLRTLFLANIAMWLVTIFFTIQPSIVLMACGMAVYLTLIPVVEASEQTILQKVIPLERQGRVFGFAQSVEQAASPVTAFLIGPIAQWVFIPFMTTGAGVSLFGWWFGSGPDRGIALLFTVAGVIGLAVTLLAMRTQAYRVLSHQYRRELAPVPIDDRLHDTGPALVTKTWTGD